MYTSFSTSSELANTLPYSVLNEAMELTYCRETGVLKLYWAGNVSRTQLEIEYEAVLQYLAHFKTKKILVCLPITEPVSIENMLWFGQEIVPRILECTQTTTFLAAVVPVDFYNNITDEFTEDTIFNQNELLEIEHFLLPEMGIDWLKSLG